MKARRIVIALLFCAAVVIAADRPQSYAVRDVAAADVQSVTLARTTGGWVETWVFTAYTTTGVSLGTVTDQRVVSGPPGVNQINALVNARLNQLNSRLDERYPPGGPPQPLAGGGQGGRP